MELTGISDDNSFGQSQLTIKLLKLLDETKYELVQENGQRRLTAPGFTGETRDRNKGCEVFLGRLPRDCYECELMPILAGVGRLLELRLMLDFSGSTRGYAFALFEKSSEARRACCVLDGYEIRPGHRIGVVKSVDNCRLFFGGVPKDKNKDDFMKELGNILDGIVDILVYPNAQDRTQNRGFIFVEFKNHRAAAMARRKLIPGRILLWNHEIAVDWADPEPGDPVDDDLMQSVTALFVRNISLDITQQRVKEIFQESTGIQILKLKKINHFAFIHYQDRQNAQRVMEIMTAPGSVADYENWEIRWAKPIGSSKKQERQRSINDALIANNNNNNTNEVKASRSNTRSSGHKKRTKKTDVETPISSLIPPVDYQRVLEIFVAGNMHANCHFECYDSLNGGYCCKVLIFDHANVIFEFQGPSFDSKEIAIEETARELYQRLSHASESHEILPSQSLAHSTENPYNQYHLKHYKNEACR